MSEGEREVEDVWSFSALSFVSASVGEDIQVRPHATWDAFGRCEAKMRRRR